MIEKIKIISCTKHREKHYNYSELIGKEFNVISEGSKYYTLEGVKGVILKSDCQAIALLTAKPMTEGKMRSCANCKETIQECACMRNICVKCNKPVGNITFSVCDDCWNILHPKLLEDYASSRSMESQWISVEDKKPEIGVIVNLVLKYSKEDVYSGFRANGGWYCFLEGENPKHYIPNGIKNVKITHWQPLPQPPTN